MHTNKVQYVNINCYDISRYLPIVITFFFFYISLNENFYQWNVFNKCNNMYLYSLYYVIIFACTNTQDKSYYLLFLILSNSTWTSLWSYSNIIHSIVPSCGFTLYLFIMFYLKFYLYILKKTLKRFSVLILRLNIAVSGY